MKDDLKDHIRRLLDRQEEDVLKALAELTGQRTQTGETIVPPRPLQSAKTTMLPA